MKQAVRAMALAQKNRQCLSWQACIGSHLSILLTSFFYLLLIICTLRTMLGRQIALRGELVTIYVTLTIVSSPHKRSFGNNTV